MAEHLLDRIHAQIRARVRELEPAIREAEQLEAAIAALDGLDAVIPAAPAVVSAAGKPRPPRRRAKRAAHGPAKRAPRGANRLAALRVLEDRPGAGATELAQATGIARPVLYNLLKTLEDRGEVAKERLPAGTIGYRLAPTSGDASS
jgi:hypothetical protein